MTMPKQLLALTTALVLSSACAVAAEPRQVVVKGKRDPSTIVIKGVRDPSGWFRIETPHLVVYSDHDPDQAIELVENLERLDHVLRLYMKPFLAAAAEPRKFTLYFQRGKFWPSELDAERKSIVGTRSSCVAATQAFSVDIGRIYKLDNAHLLKADADFTLATSMSMYALNFLERHTDIRGPHWFLEGFSAYFGGAMFTDDRMRIGAAAGSSYLQLKAVDGGSTHYLSFDDVLHSRLPKGAWADYLTWHSDRVAYETRWEFVGRSFNLVHYMLSTADNRDKMAQYLERVDNGADPAAAFSALFGLSGQGIDATMSRYRETRMKILAVNVPELPKPPISLTHLSRIEGEFVLDDAATKSCPSLDNGRKLLARLTSAAAKVPAVRFAQLALSRAQVEWGDPRDAIPYLERAAGRDDGDDPEIHYLLGLAHLKLATNAANAAEDRESLLAAARADLAQAAALAPGAPEIAYARFRTALLADDAPSRDDVALAIDAWRYGHDVVAFARAAALAHAWLGDTAGAYRAFNTLVRNERDSGDAAWAARWLVSLERGVTRDALLAAMRAERPTSPAYRLRMVDNR
jgi:hypothetical protein